MKNPREHSAKVPTPRLSVFVLKWFVSFRFMFWYLCMQKSTGVVHRRKRLWWWTRARIRTRERPSTPRTVRPSTFATLIRVSWRWFVVLDQCIVDYKESKERYVLGPDRCWDHTMRQGHLSVCEVRTIGLGIDPRTGHAQKDKMPARNQRLICPRCRQPLPTKHSGYVSWLCGLRQIFFPHEFHYKSNVVI